MSRVDVFALLVRLWCSIMFFEKGGNVFMGIIDYYFKRRS